MQDGKLLARKSYRALDQEQREMIEKRMKMRIGDR